MNIDIITLFPEMFQALHYGVISKALSNHIIKLNTWNPRDFTTNSHRTVDDRPYGGGPGMVMLYEPLAATLAHIQQQQQPKSMVIYLSPQGTPLKQIDIQQLSTASGLTLVAGRYEGIDQRFIDQHVDAVYSVGDYVVSGGELPAMLLVDAIARLRPGVLGCNESAQQDSFSHGLLEGPCYSRPEKIDEKSVPSVLLSGDHAAIKAWQQQESLRITWQKRPDLLQRRNLSAKQKAMIEQWSQASPLQQEDT